MNWTLEKISKNGQMKFIFTNTREDAAIKQFSIEQDQVSPKIKLDVICTDVWKNKLATHFSPGFLVETFENLVEIANEYSLNELGKAEKLR